jgi:hypothetical protein
MLPVLLIEPHRVHPFIISVDDNNEKTRQTSEFVVWSIFLIDEVEHNAKAKAKAAQFRITNELKTSALTNGERETAGPISKLTLMGKCHQ